MVNISFIDNEFDQYTFILREIPINSFANHPSNAYLQMKCFTYFSALQVYWNLFRFDVKTIDLSINNNFTQYPPIDSYLIALHSPNILQKVNTQDFMVIENYQKYFVTYSELNVELLPKGFESNCAEYDITNTQGKYQMETDCRVDCIAEISKDKFNSTMPPINDLIREEFGLSSFIIDYFDVKGELGICWENCKPDCISKQYLNEIHKINNNNDDDKQKKYNNYDNTVITFQHSSIPDIIVRHSFEISLMSFVCNFGGLLGIWLGFSIFSISKDIPHNL